MYTKYHVSGERTILALVKTICLHFRKDATSALWLVWTTIATVTRDDDDRQICIIEEKETVQKIYRKGTNMQTMNKCNTATFDKQARYRPLVLVFLFVWITVQVSCKKDITVRMQLLHHQSLQQSTLNVATLQIPMMGKTDSSNYFKKKMIIQLLRSRKRRRIKTHVENFHL